MHEALAVLQIGTLLSPVLINSKVFQWGSLVFINNMFEDGDENKGRDEFAISRVVTGLNHSVAQVLCDKIGSRKLGGLFTAASNDFKNRTTFEQFCIASLLIRTKPKVWNERIDDMVRNIDHDEYRLSAILKMLRNDFKFEINTPRNVDLLKELISLIQTKRSMNKKNPGNKIVAVMKQQMEKDGDFDLAEKGSDEPVT